MRAILYILIGIAATRLFINPYLDQSKGYLAKEAEAKKAMGLKITNAEKNLRQFMKENFPESKKTLRDDAVRDILG